MNYDKNLINEYENNEDFVYEQTSLNKEARSCSDDGGLAILLESELREVDLRPDPSERIKYKNINLTASKSYETLERVKEEAVNYKGSDNESGVTKNNFNSKVGKLPSVKFEEITLRESKKSKTFLEKFYPTGSLGKKRSKLLNHAFKFFDETSDSESRLKCKEKPNSIIENQDFLSKRSSSDSQLLESQKSDLTDDNASEDSIPPCERREVLNSSFRQRITKFFQDCPKYPLNSKSKQSKNNNKISDAESNKGADSNNSHGHWLFRKKLLKIRKVSTVVDKSDESSNTTAAVGTTKNIYRLTPRTKHPVETATFYVHFEKESMEGSTRDPLHDVQFFRTPHVKLKPPDLLVLNNNDEAVSEGETTTYCPMSHSELLAHSLQEPDLNTIDSITANKSLMATPSSIYAEYYMGNRHYPNSLFLKDSLVNSSTSIPPDSKTGNIAPMPRTVFHTRISPRLILRDGASLALSAKYENISAKNKDNKNEKLISAASLQAEAIYDPVDFNKFSEGTKLTEESQFRLSFRDDETVRCNLVSELCPGVSESILDNLHLESLTNLDGNKFSTCGAVQELPSISVST